MRQATKPTLFQFSYFAFTFSLTGILVGEDLTSAQYEELRQILLKDLCVLTQEWGEINQVVNRGCRHAHTGIDYGGCNRVPVFAPIGGRVTVRSPLDGTLGIYRSQNNRTYFFLHLDTISVGDGQLVKANDQIGTVGKRGDATGPHLHYEVRVGDKDTPSNCVDTTVNPFENTFLSLRNDAELEAQNAWIAEGLWHVAARRSVSGNHSWRYGLSGAPSYDLNGETNSGALVSPQFQLDSPATLVFNSWHLTEPFQLVDRKSVEISIDGNSWEHLGEVTGPMRNWVPYSISLAPFRGTARLRFLFDTVDGMNNQLEGWYVDDIEVRLRSTLPNLTLEVLGESSLGTRSSRRDNLPPSVLCVGEDFVLKVENAKINTPVRINAWKEDAHISSWVPGSTTADGIFKISGSMPPGFEGQWYEQVSVGGLESNIISFKVSECIDKEFLEGFHDTVTCSETTGWAWDPDHPNERVEIDILDGEKRLTTLVANEFRPDLYEAGIGDGHYGFAYRLPDTIRDVNPHAITARFSATEVRLTNSPRVIVCQEEPVYEGYHDTVDCSFTTGWAWDANRPNEPITVDIFDGSVKLETIIADRFRQGLVDAGKGDGRHGFIYSLPKSIKDGQEHSILVRFGGTDQNLSLSPKVLDTASCSPGPVIEPELTSNPARGQPGTVFTTRGRDFTPNNAAELHIQLPDGSEATPRTKSTNSQGQFTDRYTVKESDALGLYTLWAIDLDSGKRSNEVTQEVLEVEDPAEAPSAVFSMSANGKSATSPNDLTVQVGDSGQVRVTFDASPSRDPDGQIVRYRWREGSSLISTNRAFTKPFAPGAYSISLTVTDDDDLSDTADSRLHVLERQAGLVEVHASLNDTNWEGALSVNITGPNGTVGRSSVPTTLPDVPAGTYSVEFRGQGPENATFDGYSPSQSQDLNAGESISFNLNFSSIPLGAISLTATPQCDGNTSEIRLQWTESTGATAYRVYRDGIPRAVGSALSYTHTDLSPGIQYSYFVRANDNYGQTKDSNQVTLQAPYCSPFNFDLFRPVDDMPWHTGKPLTYKSTIYGGAPPFSYVWGGEASGSGTWDVTTFNSPGPETTLTFSTPGTKTVTLTMTDASNQTEVRSAEIDVVDPPPNTVIIHVIARLDGQPWSGAVNYEIRGRDTGHVINGTFIDPAPEGTVFDEAPPDQYTFQILSGGPSDGWRVVPSETLTLNTPGATGWFEVEFSTLSDLRPYRPSGWNASLIVSTEPNNHEHTQDVPVNEDLFVDLAIANSADAGSVPAPFDLVLLIDGMEVQRWTIPALLPGQGHTIEDFVIRLDSPGSYRVEFVIDPENEIQEKRENNNISWVGLDAS